MIVLTNMQMSKILSHAEQAYPNECCGLLVGERSAGAVFIREVHRSANMAPARANQFEIDPQLRFDLERRVREEALDLVGVYHSHPDGDAAPSQTDIQRAWESSLVWLITAVNNGSAATTRAYLVLESLVRFKEIPVKIVSN